jgi:hypothetical protein
MFTATQTAGVIAQDITQYDAQAIRSILAEAKRAAALASHAWVEDWKARTGGNEYGEPMYCGFASTKIYGVKGNTKLGKAFKAAGIEKDYSGAYSIWNPSGWAGQSMDVKEVGAQACAQVFKNYGFTAYMDSRAD